MPPSASQLCLLSSFSLVQNFIGCTIYFDHIYAKGVAFEIYGYRSAGRDVDTLHQHAIDGEEVCVGVVLKAREGEELAVPGDLELVSLEVLDVIASGDIDKFTDCLKRIRDSGIDGGDNKVAILVGGHRFLIQIDGMCLAICLDDLKHLVCHDAATAAQ